MPCPQCGTESPIGAKFCSECAAPLGSSCAACGTVNPPTAKFCSECAAPLGGSTPARPPVSTPTHAAERRLVTVLFADLVGFTPFAEERDAEEVRDTLTGYFEMARETIERYGGTVEKFIGDAVMAVWGTPLAREDDAERAVRAGLDLVADVRALGETMQARAGVLTGEAAVTIGATDQGLVAGDIVNTAARLQGVAEPGTVLVGESTMRAASAAIAFEPAGDTALKGKATPVPAYRAMRVVAERGGRNRVGGLEPPFVGREEELRQLKEQYHLVAREHRPRLVSIMGPAGIGKSRLSWEFLKYIDGVLEGVWWHSGRSPAYGEGITFWALGEMIRARAGLAESDDEAASRTAIAAMLTEHVPDEAERRWIEPAMLTLLGIGEQERGSDQHFAAWRTFFERMAATEPVMLVFEDLHWADTGLLDFIDHVLEWSRDQPIYIVTLARPELLEKRPNWGAGKRQFTSIFLEPLPEPSMRELLEGLISGLPEQAMRAIIGRADGVPLYAVETVRMLVAEGRLEERDGTYVPVGDLGGLAVPDTLTALIASRLDALESGDRALLQDASVLGQSFTTDALGAVTTADTTDLDARLRGLTRRELLVLRADPRAPDRGQYAFVQSLIREVAYNTLARPDRKSRHLAAARHFESLPTDELAGALAGHYLAAHENAPSGAEADALAAQARIALRRAAERASTLASHEQAVRFLRQAMSVTTDERDRADLQQRAGDAANNAGLYQDAIAHYSAAADLHRALGDRQGVLLATAMLGRTHLDAYDTDAAMSLLTEAVARDGDLADDPAFVTVEGQLARAHFFADQMSEAISVADRVLHKAEHHNQGDVLADTLITKGAAMLTTGRMREGLILTAGGGDLALALDLPTIALRASINRGIAEFIEDPRLALASAREGLALARRLGLRSVATVLAGNAAEYAVETGDWDWARSEVASMDESEPSHRAIGLSNQVFYTAVRGGDTSRLLSDLEAAADEAGDTSTLGQLRYARAWDLLLKGRLEEAREAFMESAATSAILTGQMTALAARCALWINDRGALAADLASLAQSGEFGRAVEANRLALHAGLAALDDATDEALRMYREARRTLNDLDLPWQVALIGLDMAHCLPLDLPEAAEARGESRRILERLGATALLDQLDELEHRPKAGGDPAVDRSAGRAAAPERA